MLGGKIRDKKMAFIEPATKLEQDNWLEKIIAEISSLNKKEYADLLSNEIEFLLNIIIPELEKESIITDVGAPVVIAGDTHG